MQRLLCKRYAATAVLWTYLKQSLSFFSQVGFRYAGDQASRASAQADNAGRWGHRFGEAAGCSKQSVDKMPASELYVMGGSLGVAYWHPYWVEAQLCARMRLREQSFYFLRYGRSEIMHTCSVCSHVGPGEVIVERGSTLGPQASEQIVVGTLIRRSTEGLRQRFRRAVTAPLGLRVSIEVRYVNIPRI